jgi:hypothetical protein
VNVRPWGEKDAEAIGARDKLVQRFPGFGPKARHAIGKATATASR